MDKLCGWIGLAGVAHDESAIAQNWSRYFGVMMSGALLWMILQWHFEITQQMGPLSSFLGHLFIWSFFVIETLVLLLLVKRRFRYLRQNWLNIIIIVGCLPLLFWEIAPMMSLLRGLRILLIIGLIIPWVTMCFRFLTDNRLDTTVIAVFVIIFLAGVCIVEIDPGINTIADGIWWAWVTISTVGYGDVVPQSHLGRAFAALLILIGMGLFSVITANFAALFVQRDAQRNKAEMEKLEQNNLAHLKASKIKEDEMLVLLEKLHHRIDDLESALAAQKPTQ